MMPYDIIQRSHFEEICGVHRWNINASIFSVPFKITRSLWSSLSSSCILGVVSISIQIVSNALSNPYCIRAHFFFTTPINVTKLEISPITGVDFEVGLHQLFASVLS